MGYIANSKWGNCSRCPSKNVACKKRGKDLVCIPCCNKEDAKRQTDKAKETQKIRMLSGSNIGSGYLPANNKLVDNKAAKQLSKLGTFFRQCAMEIAKHPFCLNCGERIINDVFEGDELSSSQLTECINATAHILPKNIFHSVETHPLIWLPIAARCGCHHDTHRLDKFSQMKCFPQAVKQFRQIEHLITEKHDLLNLFREYADKAEQKK